jgi:cation diffusion facilitator CzcD-associated flavoprotein CzcO
VSRSDVQVLVLGGGPAGLATSAELRRRGVDHLILERGPRVGHTWENLYESLTLHTGKHMSALPGMRFPRATPLFPARADFVEYLHRYADTFQLPVQTQCNVSRVERHDGRWQVSTSRGDLSAQALVVATGIVASPRIPVFPGRERFSGRVIHSVEYRQPDGYAGRRVLVVGVGNSGGEIGSELAHAGAEVTVAVRSGANVVPLQLLGLPIQYASYLLRKLPRKAQEVVAAGVAKITERRRGPPVLPRPAHSALDAIPLIGFHLVDAIREGRIRVVGGVAGFTADGVQFDDGTDEPFDEVILATGFNAAVGTLDGLIQRDERGFARRTERVVSTDHRDLYFVGHNYDATGGLFNIARDSRLAAARIAQPTT